MPPKANLIRRSPAKRTKATTPAQIDRTRDRYVEMIALARKLEPHPNAMIDKAHRLLTRHWAKSSWASRTDILRTVDWLLKVGTIHPGSGKDSDHSTAR